MSLIELFLLAVGLSMDAFAVAVCKGLSTQRLCPRHYLIVGTWFGGFQALMPTLGWLLGSTFAEHITRFDHWIAFVLLALIGGNDPGGRRGRWRKGRRFLLVQNHAAAGSGDQY